MNQPSNSRFKFFPQLNDLAKTELLSSANSFYSGITDKYFQSDSLQDTLLREISAAKLLSIKEVLETFEFFARIRKSTKTQSLADLCCGHGLLGILFAMFERKVVKVILIDKAPNQNRTKLLEIADQVAPWVRQKVENHVSKVDPNADWIVPGCAIVSAHACGVLSDLCIDIAIKTGGPIALLPCCYPRSKCRAPMALQTQFGLEAAFDIDRTYRLEAAGYQVRWAAIPQAITPMNRILYARRTNSKKVGCYVSVWPLVDVP